MTPEQLAAIERGTARAAAIERGTARAAAQQGVGSTAPAAQPQEAPAQSGRAANMGAGSAGVNDKLIRGFLGLKSTVMDLSEDDKLVKKQMETESNQEKGGDSFLRGAGGLVTEIGATAFPGALIGKAIVKGVQAVRYLRAAAPVAGAAVSSGVLGTALTPSTAEGPAARLTEKAKQGLSDAAVGAGLQGVGSALRKTTTGLFKPSADAVKMADAGVHPTLAQGAEGRMAKSIGSLAAGGSRPKERQSSEVGESLLRKITEGNVDLPAGTGRDFVDAGQHYVSGAYDKIFGNKKFLMSEALVGRANAAASQLTRTGGGGVANNKANAIIADTIDVSNGSLRLTQREMQNALVQMQEKAAKESPELIRAVERARQVFKNSVRARLTPEQRLRLDDVDKLNFDLSRLKEATAGTAAEEVGVNASRLARAYADKSMPGVTTLEDLVGPIQRTLKTTPASTGRGDVVAGGRILAGASLGTLGGIGVFTSNPWLAAPLGAAVAASVVGQTRRGSRALMGLHPAQQNAAAALRRIGPYGYGLGSVVGPEEEQQ